MKLRVLMVTLALACACDNKSEAPSAPPMPEQKPVQEQPVNRSPEGYGEEYKYEPKPAEPPPKEPEPMPATPAANNGPVLGIAGDGAPADPQLVELRHLEVARAEAEKKEQAASLKAAIEEPAPDPAKMPVVEKPADAPEVVDELDMRASGRRFARRDGDMEIVSTGVDGDRYTKPATVLPRTFYFENTYLGGSAAYAERLRRLDASLGEGERHYRRVQAETQPFDPPERAGLALYASADATHIDRGQRVFLQIGLRGSDHYGWRRPALDLVLVVDYAAFAQGSGAVTSFISEVMRKLEPADRFGIVLAGDGDGEVYLPLSGVAQAQQQLARTLDSLVTPIQSDEGLARGMGRAAVMLAEASNDEAVVPGSQTVLVLTGGDGPARVAAATRIAHGLTVQGAVTSVFALDTQQGDWWQVANAGYGNFHRISRGPCTDAIEEELSSLSRVVARLVRVNVRLGKDVDAVRVLGTRVLDQAEANAVKAREVAQDRNLSKSMGISSDRGDDDDGIQTVIPYFYGDDSHVILIELWVAQPGTVADVSLRYKDMLNLDNAEARTSVVLGGRPQEATPEQIRIAQNVRGFMLGESLQHAANRVRAGDAAGAMQAIEGAGAMAAETNDADRAAVEGLRALVVQPSWQNNPARQQAVEETLLISGQRRVGDTNLQELNH